MTFVSPAQPAQLVAWAERRGVLAKLSPVAPGWWVLSVDGFSGSFSRGDLVMTRDGGIPPDEALREVGELAGIADLIPSDPGERPRLYRDGAVRPAGDDERPPYDDLVPESHMVVVRADGRDLAASLWALKKWGGVQMTRVDGGDGRIYLVPSPTADQAAEPGIGVGCGAGGIRCSLGR